MGVPVRAGVLNRRVILQKVTQSSDTEGASFDLWENVRTVWAAINPAGGRLTQGAAQPEEHITHQVTLRYQRGISPRMRLLYDGRVYFIHTVFDPDTSHIELDLLCEEIVTSALDSD